MSLRLFVGVAVLAVAVVSGPSRAAAQDAAPSSAKNAPELVASRAVRGAPSGSWQEPLQEVGRNRTRGALWGGGVGLVAGGLVGGLTAESDDGGDFGGSLVESAATGEAVLLGAMVGGAIGALLGATVFAPARRSSSGGASGFALAVHPSGEAIAVAGRVRVGR